MADESEDASPVGRTVEGDAGSDASEVQPTDPVEPPLGDGVRRPSEGSHCQYVLRRPETIETSTTLDGVRPSSGEQLRGNQ